MGFAGYQRLNKVCNRMCDMICTYRTLLWIGTTQYSPMLWSGSARGVHNSKMVKSVNTVCKTCDFLEREDHAFLPVDWTAFDRRVVQPHGVY